MGLKQLSEKQKKGFREKEKTKLLVLYWFVTFCFLILASGREISAALINNYVGFYLEGEFSQSSSGNFGPLCGFDAENNRGIILLRLIERGIDLRPENPSGWLALGRFYWMMGQCDQSIEEVTTSSHLSKSLDHPANYELARMLYMSDERDDSIRVYRTLAAAHLVARQADRARVQGDYQTALLLYEFASEIEPAPDIRKSFRIVTDEVLNLPAPQAREIWQELSLKTKSNQAAYWRAAGELAVLAGDTSTAKDAFLTGLSLSDDGYDFYLALARTSSKLEEWEEAVNNYELALDENPNESVLPYIKIAEIKLMLGNHSEFVLWCDKARSVFPKSHWPDFSQGLAAYQSGRLDEAETYFRNAHQLAPNDPYTLYYLGEVNELQNNTIEAASYYEQATDVNPVPAEICTWLLKAGEAYQRVEDLPKAGQMYEKGTTICPQDPTLRERFDAIRLLQDR